MVILDRIARRLGYLSREDSDRLAQKADKCWGDAVLSSREVSRLRAEIRVLTHDKAAAEASAEEAQKAHERALNALFDQRDKRAEITRKLAAATATAEHELKGYTRMLKELTEENRTLRAEIAGNEGVLKTLADANIAKNGEANRLRDRLNKSLAEVERLRRYINEYGSN